MLPKVLIYTALCIYVADDSHVTSDHARLHHVQYRYANRQTHAGNLDVMFSCRVTATLFQIPNQPIVFAVR